MDEVFFHIFATRKIIPNGKLSHRLKTKSFPKWKTLLTQIKEQLNNLQIGNTNHGN